ncbi:kelch-like protein 10 [Zootermopsis nevadensis]|nr:kelch-like protein 10 [Zootermopsis nevadensis]
MKKRRLSASAAVLNDKIYVAGGNNCNGFLNSVEVYNPDTDQWTFVAPMHSGRSNFSCVAFHGCLYALGGDDETSDELSAEKYDPAKDTWTMIAGMNFYADYCNAEVIDDTIFVIGGGCKGEADFCVKCYNDKEDKWYLAADMNVCRYAPSTCVIKNLPNASDYAYKQKDKLMEERRKKTSNWENQ